LGTKDRGENDLKSSTKHPKGTDDNGDWDVDGVPQGYNEQETSLIFKRREGQAKRRPEYHYIPN
jgi:hypothetical protein